MQGINQAVIGSAGPFGAFSSDKKRFEVELGALQAFLWDPNAEVTSGIKDLFTRAFPLSYKRGIEGVHDDLFSVAQDTLDRVEEGTISKEDVEARLFNCRGPVQQCLRVLRYLGETKSTDLFYQKSTKSAEIIICRAEEEYFRGCVGSVPMLIDIIAKRQFGGEVCELYTPPESLALLRRLSALGIDKARQELLSVYVTGMLGVGREEGCFTIKERVNLSEEERFEGIKELAQEGDVEAFQALSRIALGRWAKRDQAFAFILENEPEGVFLEAVDRALALGWGIEMTPQERIEKLKERAQKGSSFAAGVLCDAFQKGVFGEISSANSTEMSQQVLFNASEADLNSWVPSLTGYRLAEFVLANPSIDNAEVLLEAVERGDPDALEGYCALDFLPPENSQSQAAVCDFLQCLADDGSEKAIEILLRKHKWSPVTVAGKIIQFSLEKRKLRAWALAGSPIAAEQYIEEVEEDLKPVLKELFALTAAVKLSHSSSFLGSSS